MPLLSGKVAVVTASTQGIGLAIARRLALDGAQVVISSRKQANVDRALEELHAEGLTISGIVCHVGKREDREEAWDKTFEVNVKAVFLLTKLVVPHMEQRGRGSIVLVGSIAGYRPFPTIGPYGVSKTALLGLTKVLADELAPANIRVNCLAPGLITQFSSALWSDDSFRRRFEAAITLRRTGEPEDCAGVVSFLCSRDAAYITGETITVAGGFHCRL
ncbi:dehydrogenase/reductase SDR family member 4 isoform X3 [Cetorhinus maximus]